MRARRLLLPGRARRVRPLEVDGRPSFTERVYGLGSVFGKSLSDSRRAILLAGPLLALLVIFTASQVAAEFGTAAARAAMAALPQQLPPIFRGMLGEPIRLETLGGFLSWRTLNFMPIYLGAWSIIALSGTLATEARRGSLDLVLSSPVGRVSVALQKAAAFGVALGIATLIVGLALWFSGNAFATLPGDEIAVGDALSHAVWLWTTGLFPGAIAWLVAPILGRGGAAAVGALVMVASYVVNGYRELLPAFETLDGISYFGLTAGHRPIAGTSDWAPVLLVAGMGVALLLAGALLFRMRDVGATAAVGLPLPQLGLGLSGPLGRSFAERLSVAAAWGLGLGVFGFVFAANADQFVTALRAIPQVERIFGQLFPGVDMLTVGGILQLVFFGFGSLLMAAAAGMLANGWASDETERRLEVVLSAPVSRVRWALAGGLGVLAALAVATVLMAALIGSGTALVTEDVTTPVIGAGVLGLYAMALAGVALAVGGLLRPTLAAGVAVGLGVAFYLLDTLGAALNLPDAVLQLSLTKHLGQPMAGALDTSGIVACAVLAVGGVIASAIGLRLRDIGR